MRRSAAQVVFGCASVLLSYPAATFTDDLAAVATGLSLLPKSASRTGLEDAHRWLAGMSIVDAAACYVETFDLHRRRSLHLTYYRHGDTRERGMALTALVEVYRDAGARIVPGELPDFLPALLELAAITPAGAAVLGEHRAALDALGGELEKDSSGYAKVLSAVTGALGPSSRADQEALRRYRLNGPPSEHVGLEPFAPPEVISLGVTRR